MASEDLDLPTKRREIHNHHMDSTAWNDFLFRDGDIVVGTYGKAGTTWTQQIVAQLLSGADEQTDVHGNSPWWDLRLVPPEAREAVLAQQGRRMLKTHLPADALVMSGKAKYIYVARDGRDVVWSLYNHHAGFVDEAYERFNGPGLIGEPLPRPDTDIRNYFLTWLERDGYPWWSFWENTATWWKLRDRPNVMLLHFNALKADLEGEMRRIAAFLDIELSEETWPVAVQHCTFDYMKANAERYAPGGGTLFQGGAGTFINKGSNGRWKDILSSEDCARYEQTAVERLGIECARWLATGAVGEQ